MEFPHFESLDRDQAASLCDTLREIQNESAEETQKFTRYRHGFEKLLEIIQGNGLMQSDPRTEKIRARLVAAVEDCKYQVACLSRLTPDRQNKINELRKLLARKNGSVSQTTL